ncbi:acyl-[acyl-carrier-protein] thioesterase [Leptospira idonii]|uniref:Acyl-[acyl-carrier-protein] thioesterase n=1 Tax=Leptospira idonii TaxID=1193500 RepID=A0A4R9M2T7_9LEPT|nr:acyl-[acyl-carrier-protein] thioesterase [Leptospira idonii]TGN20205.1 acyl-[acyl-carrier-protein] thioesterase [Leptospira idonii]
MPIQKTVRLRTHTFDLDWNRHVTSRTYEKFGYDARFSVLEDLGYSVSHCLENEIHYVSHSTFVRFLGQQFANSDIDVITELSQDEKGLLYWKQNLIDANGKPACELLTTSYLEDKNKNKLKLDAPGLKEEWKESKIHDRNKDQFTLQHSLNIPFSDMNCFWNLPSDSIWKIFEEGRFLFFKEIVDLSLIRETDTTTFFMGGEIQIKELPAPGSQIILHSWIESFEKIRFYFRQDITDKEGNVLVSMRDEQLFVALSASRPKKAPPEFITKVEKFIEKP